MTERPPSPVVCAFCHARLADGAARRCGACQASHHADCWTENGGCAAAGCAGAARAAATPELPRPIGAVPEAAVPVPHRPPTAPMPPAAPPRPAAFPPAAPPSPPPLAPMPPAPPPAAWPSQGNAAFDAEPAPWARQPLVWVLAIVAVVIVGAVVASDPGTATVSPPPSSPGSSSPGASGGDPVLDELKDQCGAGDRSACDDLYWQSPVGSDYEAYAQARRRETTTPGDGYLALSLVWAELSTWERQEACDEYRMFGREAARVVAEASEGAVTTTEAAAFFDERC